MRFEGEKLEKKPDKTSVRPVIAQLGPGEKWFKSIFLFTQVKTKDWEPFHASYAHLIMLKFLTVSLMVTMIVPHIEWTTQAAKQRA